MRPSATATTSAPVRAKREHGCPLLAWSAPVAELPLAHAVLVDLPTASEGLRPDALRAPRSPRRYRALVAPRVSAGFVLLPAAAFLRDRAASRWYGGAPLRPGEDLVTPSIATYQPTTVASTVWELVGPAARRWAATVPAESGRQAVSRLKPLAQYLAWRVEGGLLIDDPVDVFHPADVERFVTEGCAHLANSSRSAYRSALRTVGEHVVGTEVACPARTLPVARPAPRKPYSTAEFSALLAGISGLRTAAARHNAMALVALGRGAGLRAGDVAAVVGSDVARTTDGTLVIHVAGPGERVVPVVRMWETEVERLAELVGHRPMFRSRRSRIGHRDIGQFCARIRFRSAPILSVTRLRATWIVEHLQAGTPLPVLAAAAGADVTQIARYYRFLPSVPVAEAHRWLRR